MLNSFIFAFTFCPTPFSLPTDSQIHTLSVFVFWTHCDDNEVRLFSFANSFCIDFQYTSMVTIFILNNRKPDIVCLLSYLFYF